MVTRFSISISCVLHQDLLGDEGVLQCRSLLDGMEGRSDSYLQQIISEGRCVVCNHSTFEEDMAQQAAQRSANGKSPRLVWVFLRSSSACAGLVFSPELWHV